MLYFAMQLVSSVRPYSYLRADFGSSILSSEQLFHVYNLLSIHVRVSGLTLQVHTLPVATPIPILFPHTAEHDGRYSDGIHNKFLPPYLIHMLSELRLVPRY